MSDQEDRDRAARLEELRFAKKQQWYIATSAVTLLAAIFGIAHVFTPKPTERVVAIVLVGLVVGFACWFLWKLQNHLKATRSKLEPQDENPWFRGVDVLAALAGIVLVSGFVVAYYLWFRARLMPGC